jgi:hypothetical protein
MSKIITDELIEARLRKINVLEKEELDHEQMLESITDYFEFEITDNWPNNPDMMFYSETTADGYEVWIATDNERNPHINSDIYYYNNDWLKRMPDAMIDGASIYYENLNDKDYAFQEIVENVYDDYYNNKKQEIENELIEEGYEYEDEN